MVIVSGRDMKKKVAETSIFEVRWMKSLRRRLCTSPLGEPPSRQHTYTQQGEKQKNTP